MPDVRQYTLPELPYGYRDLEPTYSSEMLELHHDKHHRAYVDGVEKALAALADVRDSRDYGKINQLQKDLAFNLSGHVLHSIFWCNMSPDGGSSPSGGLANAIDEAFGGTDALREQLSQAATGIQGSGWGALCFEPMSGRLIVEQIYDHQSNLSNASIPLLVLDMWEHAYYLQYKNDKSQWVEGFWDLVDWTDVGRRFDRVEPLDLALAA
jgi:Fe-Mn family superoxide dismutase